MLELVSFYELSELNELKEYTTLYEKDTKYHQNSPMETTFRRILFPILDYRYCNPEGGFDLRPKRLSLLEFETWRPLGHHSRLPLVFRSA